MGAYYYFFYYFPPFLASLAGFAYLAKASLFVKAKRLFLSRSCLITLDENLIIDLSKKLLVFNVIINNGFT